MLELDSFRKFDAYFPIDNRHDIVSLRSPHNEIGRTRFALQRRGAIILQNKGLDNEIVLRNGPDKFIPEFYLLISENSNHKGQNLPRASL